MIYFTNCIEEDGRLSLVKCECGHNCFSNSIMTVIYVSEPKCQYCFKCDTPLINYRTQEILVDNYRILSKKQYQMFLKLDKIV